MGVDNMPNSPTTPFLTNGPTMKPEYESTLVHLFSRQFEIGGSRDALLIYRAGQFRPYSWDHIAGAAQQMAALLVEMGVKPGDRVVQVSENRYEWIITDLGIHLAQAIHVPVHAPLTGAQIAHQIYHSGAEVVLLSGPEQATKLASVANTLPPGLQFLAYEQCSETIAGQTPDLWADRMAAADITVGQQTQQQALDTLTPDSLATILYTSGTTGEPKGVMLNHRNLVSNTLGTLETVGIRSDDLRLCFLPLSHIFARTCDLYTWLASGTILALAQSRETVLADCKAVGATLMSGVPYFYDKVAQALVAQGRADEPGALREILGGSMRFCFSGGAALPDHTFEFYQARGVPVTQGYGLTESSPVITISVPQTARIGAVGMPIPEVEVRIADDGEILTRGPHVMVGYWRDAQATVETVRDGWLHTGDIGKLHDDGMLQITGRKKELIVTSGGKNIAPVYIESLLTQDRLISQVLVIGNDRKFLTALIVPDRAALKQMLDSDTMALDSPEVYELYRQRVSECLRDVAAYEQVGQFSIIDREFSVETGELTPKLSLRRPIIEKNYAASIEAMYAQPKT